MSQNEVALFLALAVLTTAFATAPSDNRWRRTERLAHMVNQLTSPATWEGFELTLVCTQQGSMPPDSCR